MPAPSHRPAPRRPARRHSSWGYGCDEDDPVANALWVFGLGRRLVARHRKGVLVACLALVPVALWASGIAAEFAPKSAAWRAAHHQPAPLPDPAPKDPADDADRFQPGDQPWIAAYRRADRQYQQALATPDDPHPELASSWSGSGLAEIRAAIARLARTRAHVVPQPDALTGHQVMIEDVDEHGDGALILACVVDRTARAERSRPVEPAVVRASRHRVTLRWVDAARQVVRVDTLGVWPRRRGCPGSG